MLLSDRDLRKELDSGRLGVDPFDPAMLQPASIDVRLDRFFRVFDNSKYTHIDPQLQQDELTSLVEKEGEDPPGLSVGTLSLFHGDVKVGEGKIKTQPGKFSIAGDGLCVGRDSSDPVTTDYPGTAPFTFTGGTIDRVVVDVSGEPYVDLEREAVAMLECR